MIKPPIYLDYNATTPTDPQVVEVMLPYFNEKFGNASSVQHVYGWDAEEAVTEARDQVAELIAAKPSEITFTSGATEAINILHQGYYQSNRSRGNHIITCCTEHKAVLDTCQALEDRGARVTYLSVDADGVISLEELEASISSETILISIMYANNETGVIQPIQEIAAIAKSHEVVFFSDATQAVGKVPVDVHDLGLDAIAFSGHKMYGPKGVGGLFMNKKAKANLSPITFGGGQEKGYRPGTLNVPAIVGLGKAAQMCAEMMTEEAERLASLRDQLEQKLAQLEGCSINGQGVSRLSHVTNVSFENIDGSSLIRSLHQLAVSQGSACNSNIIEPSHVLLAMGLSQELALSSLRVSLGRYTMDEDINLAAQTIHDTVNSLRLQY